MLKWLKSLFLGPQPSGPPQTFRAFDTSEPMISKDLVKVENDAFVVEAREKTTVTLFEVKKPDLEQCMLTYRAKAKAEDINGRAYLEMQLKFPKLGEHCAKGVNCAVSGSTDWTPMEAPVLLDVGQKPEMMRLNVVMEGPGKVRMKDVEVVRQPVV
ncbi:hypothetical protein ACFL2Q_18250 [Thermodesulfobacteriota bacterium]